MASYSFASYDAQTYEKLVATADGEFSAWGSSFNADFSAKLDDISRKTGVTYNFKQFGIGFSTSLPPPDKLVQFVLDFGSLELDQPAVLEFSTTSYTTLKDCPAEFETVDEYRLQWDDDSGIDTGDGLATVVVHAQSIQETIKATRQLYDFYGCLGVDSKLASIAGKLRDMLRDISKWREAVQKDPTKTGIAPPTVDKDALQFPIAQWSLVTAPGGPSQAGGAFADISMDMITKLVRLEYVTFHGGDSIDRIIATYTLQNGEVQNFTNWHGGEGGDDYGTIAFGPGDQITSLSSKWWWGDDLVKAVNIASTSNPGGRELPSYKWPDINATWTRAPDTCFVGFAGFSNDYLAGLSAQYVQFLPCAWKEPSSARRRLPKPEPPSLYDPISMYSILKDSIIRPNWDKIQMIYKQKGGWEGWLQVELANYLYENYAPAWTIERERQVYVGSGKKADITLTKMGQTSHVVELKVESMYQDLLSDTSLFDRLKDDIDKLNFANFDTNLGTVQAYAYGICVKQAYANIGENYVWTSRAETPKSENCIDWC